MPRRISSMTQRFASIAIAMMLMLPGFTMSESTLAVQTDPSIDPAAEIWTLIPANATVVLSINTDPENPQWAMADKLLVAGGIDHLVYGVIDSVIRSAEIPYSNVRPGQSSILGGAVALAIWGDPTEPGERIAVYIAASDPDAAYRSVVAQLITESNAVSTEVTVPGGVATITEDNDGVIMLLGSTVVITESEAANQIATLLSGSGPVLSEFEPFQESMAVQSPDQIARAYLNGPAFGLQLIPLLVDSFGLAPSEIAVLSVLGGQFATAHTSVGLHAGDNGFNLRIAQHPAPLIGAPLPSDGPSVDLATLVSADADLFMSGTDLGSDPLLNRLVVSALSGIANPRGNVDPITAMSSPDWPFSMIRDEYGIDVRAEFLDQLRGDFFIAASAASIQTPGDLDLLLMSELDDPATVRQLFKTLVTAYRLTGGDENIAISTSNVDGSELHSLAMADVGLTLEFGVLDDQLVIALGDGRTALDATATGSSLADDPEFRSAIESLPEPGGSQFFVRVPALLDMLDQTGIISNSSDFGHFDGLKAIVGNTYESNGLAITDILIQIDAMSGANDDIPAATPASD